MSDYITSALKETRVFPPPENLKREAHIRGEAAYESLYRESIENPEAFWAREARQNIDWIRPWSSVLEWDFSKIGEDSRPFVQFFIGAKLNVSANCLDRHLAKLGNEPAILWQGEVDSERRVISFRELYEEVVRFSHVLKRVGVRRGSRVTLYMPMVPEAAVAMLACTRVGAIHSVVFSAFSPESLKNRILDCGSELVITADAGWHGGKKIPLKSKVDEALEGAATVKKVIVFNRLNVPVRMESGRDLFWHEEMARVKTEKAFEPEEMDSEDPLFILYTSGSTGKPKGVLHTTAGYLLQAHLTFKYLFDARPGQIHFCTADVGWVTGHTYGIYGPLSNGVTTIMFEGIPTYPNPGRFWQIIERYRATIFYTAPTAIRALMRLGDSWPKKFDLSSLRVIGSVGEPINPEAWMWYYRVVAEERAPIMDTWWQTETGGILISPFPGATATKPGSASKPFFGVVPEVVSPDGARAGPNEGGSLVITRPWPGMIRGVWGDPTHKIIRDTYFSAFPGKYFTGDGARVDEEGFYWLLGRIDDVLNVSAHRFATAEIESALVAHPAVAEAAVVGYPHEIKGQGIYCFVTLKEGVSPGAVIEKELIQKVRASIGPIATPDRIQFAPALPKTRSGKIMRRILRKIAEGDAGSIGDTSTLADPSVVESLVRGASHP